MRRSPEMVICEALCCNICRKTRKYQTFIINNIYNLYGNVSCILQVASAIVKILVRNVYKQLKYYRYEKS